MRAADIKIRDPFILPVAAEQTYYLFGTTDTIPWGDHPGTGFDTYRSRNLIDWEGPFPAFRPPPGFWGTQHFWAPEVHAWRGRYYMFASFKSATVHRGTQILVADHPLGPFRPQSPLPVTPVDCECLDGTLHIDADGRPWMIFSRDWPQVTIGRYSAVPLREDFTAAAGPAIELFPVNAAPWVIAPPWQAEQRAKEGLSPCFVADGAWPFRMQDGEFCLLFSSWTANGYATGIARSASGTLAGPWRFDPAPLFDKDGGHAMMFQGFDGRSYFTLHQPNDPPPEHPRIFPVEESAGHLRLGPALD
jgi:arabinan endo-1,5-alpha-L-arabinosidase